MDLSIAHADVIAATRRGFAFLLANGLGWWVVGVLAFRWPVRRVATLLLFMGAVTMPLAFALRGWLGFPDYDPANPLNALALLIAFAPAVAFPAIVITYLQAPRYLPAVMAALLGGHFLPYAWLYQTNAYLVLGIVVSAAPSVLLLVARERGFALGPLAVGAALVGTALVLW